MKVSDLCGLDDILDGVSSLRGLDQTIGALFSDLRAELGCEDEGDCPPCHHCPDCGNCVSGCVCEDRNDDNDM